MSFSVLVVDDDIGFRDLARRVLIGCGYSVIGEAGTIAEALQRLRHLRPDAAVVDVGLPDGSGLALSRRLSEPPWSMRVLLVSADGGDVDATAATACGAVAFLQKDELSGPVLRRLLGPP